MRFSSPCHSGDIDLTIFWSKFFPDDPGYKNFRNFRDSLFWLFNHQWRGSAAPGIFLASYLPESGFPLNVQPCLVVWAKQKPEHPNSLFGERCGEKESITIRNYAQNMPFVYSIIWFMNAPESIAETIENPCLIVYSGKITLFMAFFIPVQQLLGHPGILNNQREYLGIFLTVPCNAMQNLLSLVENPHALNRSNSRKSSYSLIGLMRQNNRRKDSISSPGIRTCWCDREGRRRIICHIRITVAKTGSHGDILVAHQPDDLCADQIVEENKFFLLPPIKLLVILS